MSGKINRCFQTAKWVLTRIIFSSFILFLANAVYAKQIIAENTQKTSPLSPHESQTPVKALPFFKEKIKKPFPVTAKTAKKTKSKRAPANTAYNCEETFEDQFSIGYVRLGYGCDTQETVCIAWFRIERNTCKGDTLTRYYCAPEQQSLFNTEQLKCPQGCDPSGLFCASSSK